MNQEITNKIIDLLNNIQNGVNIASKGAVVAGKEAVTLALQATSLDAFQNIVFGVIGIFILIIPTICLKHLICQYKNYKPKGYTDGFFMDNPWALLYAALIVIIALIGFFTVLCNLFDVYNWVGIFNPKIYLAHEIMQRYLGS